MKEGLRCNPSFLYVKLYEAEEDFGEVFDLFLHFSFCAVFLFSLKRKSGK